MMFCLNGKASSPRNTNGICSSVPGSGAGSGRSNWPHSNFCPKVEWLNTPRSSDGLYTGLYLVVGKEVGQWYGPLAGIRAVCDT